MLWNIASWLAHRSTDKLQFDSPCLWKVVLNYIIHGDVQHFVTFDINITFCIKMCTCRNSVYCNKVLNFATYLKRALFSGTGSHMWNYHKRTQKFCSWKFSFSLEDHKQFFKIKTVSRNDLKTSKWLKNLLRYCLKTINSST